MNAKIDALTAPRPVSGVRPAASTGPGLSSDEPVRRISGSDQLKLTNTAVLLAQIEPEVAAAPDIDTARVDALRTAIGEGRYTVRNEVVTDRLLKMERDLNASGYERPGPR